MVRSEETRNFGITVKEYSVVLAFTEITASQMVGMQLPGSILKCENEFFDYRMPEPEEVIELSLRWVFSPEEVSLAPEKTEPPPMEYPLASFSNNGVAAMLDQTVNVDQLVRQMQFCCLPFMVIHEGASQG